MKKVKFGNTELQVPAIVMGCMRLNSLDISAAAKHIENAVNHEVNFFDHADIMEMGNVKRFLGRHWR